QTAQLIMPILNILQQSIAYTEIETHLISLLRELRQRPIQIQGYAPSNIMALLRVLRQHLRKLDLSRLSIRGAYLQGVEMQDSSLFEAVMSQCSFTESFDGIVSLTVSADGRYIAASSETGEARLWKADDFTLYRIWQDPEDILYRIAL